MIRKKHDLMVEGDSKGKGHILCMECRLCMGIHKKATTSLFEGYADIARLYACHVYIMSLLLSASRA